MNFINIEGDLKQQSKILKGKINKEKEWFKISLFKFFKFRVERAMRNDIVY